jgi:hypothetical protein
MSSRRTFVGWLSGLGAALGIGVRARPSQANAAQPAEQSGSLDAAMVRSVADAVLPSELGNDGIARTSRAFSQWIAGYRPGVEIVHPYGSAELRQTGESPVGRWRSQLSALERSAREKYQRAFTSLTRDQRRELVMQALADDRLNRLPDPLQANHVAMGILAWYFATPDAADLCYSAQIGRNQCRPLVHSSRQPLPIQDGGGRMSDGGHAAGELRH